MAVGGMFTVFVFSRLWRRSEVITDVELIELRYGGKPAAFLRGFRSIYVAIPLNCIIIGWVTGAMLKIIKYAVLGQDPLAAGGPEEEGLRDWMIIVGCLVVVGIYSAMSGLWGVAITDFIQFILAMGGCIILAWLAVKDVGGVGALKEQTAAAFGGGEQAFRFFPKFTGEGAWMPIQLFLIYLFVLWWASWYPGAEPGGGGYVVQRMASCKDEKHSLLATLWFQVAHYCVRPWPWLLIAFVAVAKYPELRTNWLADPSFDPGAGFPMMMRDLLPAGLRGLLLVAFFAAFMSTLSTQINWGASYLVSDFYRRFIRPDATDKHLAKASRVVTVLLLCIGGLTAYGMRDVSVDNAWKLLAAFGAGTGAVFMLRWFWWRINAWTEIAAMVSSFVYFVGLKIWVAALKSGIEPGAPPSKAVEILGNYDYQLAIVAGLTVITWLVVTFLTPPERKETLIRFFRKIHPSGPGWDPVAAEVPDMPRGKTLGPSILAAVFGIGVVYLTLPGVGLVILGQTVKGVACLAGAAVCAGAIVVLLNKIGWERIAR
jgi:Na+/proline symporter